MEDVAQDAYKKESQNVALVEVHSVRGVLKWTSFQYQSTGAKEEGDETNNHRLWLWQGQEIRGMDHPNKWTIHRDQFRHL